MTEEFTDAQIVDTITRGIGYRPLDAFVVLPFCVHEEAPLVVADLPTTANKATLRRFSTAIAAAASREPWASSAVVVLYTSAEYGDPAKPFGFDFVWEACHKMHRAGLHPTALFCVAADGWGEYTLKGDVGPRFERRPLSELLPLPIREL